MEIKPYIDEDRPVRVRVCVCKYSIKKVTNTVKIRIFSIQLSDC